MRSRLLNRLDAAIARTRNPVALACLRAERAGFLARQGHLLPARKMIDQITAQYAWRPHAAVSAWLSLAEGLYEHFSRLGPTARDRIQRAYALSGAADLAPLHALAAAWLANMDYNHHDGAQMAKHAREALLIAAPEHHAARSRATLVVAQAYHFAGRMDRAMPWYARSRQHAAAEGDESHLLALMHNQAWLRASQARLATLFGEAPPDDARQVALSVQSTQHFNEGVHGTALPSLVPLLHAQVLCIEGRASEALAIFVGQLDDAMRDGLENLAACFHADMAWCRCQLGDAAGALDDVRAAERALLKPCDVDDRAMAQARIAEVLASLGDEPAAARYRERAQRDLQVHKAEQARLAVLLDESLADVPEAGIAPGADALRTAPC